MKKKTLSVALLLTILALPAAAFADRSRVVVYLDGSGCPIYTRTATQNCGGEHKVNESCRARGDRIWWEVSDKSFADQIELRWNKGTPNPLTSCKLKASGGKIAKCRIDRATAPGNYDYSIFVRDGCELDPRIIVN